MSAFVWYHQAGSGEWLGGDKGGESIEVENYGE